MATHNLRSSFVVLMFFASIGCLFGQTGAGRIQGTVKDASGAVIPAAKITALQVETGSSFHTQGNDTGFYIFPSMQPGKYRVTADAQGFEKWAGDLQLQTGQQAVIDPVLAVGAQATQIVVAGDVTPLVTTTTPTLSNVLERERIEQLPLNGRGLGTLLTITTPGLEGGGGKPKTLGLRDSSMQFLQDGVSLNDANVGSLTSRPPGLDTIQEYRVETSVASAKFSRPASTMISTRSGTNDVHGALFYTGRNNGFGVARQRQDYYDKPPQLIRNEYGASVGGPVVLPHLYDGKNRTFFFFAWEGMNLRSQETISTKMPTLAMRQGDFSQLKDSLGRQYTLYDPWSTASEAQNWGRVPFPGNILPMGKRSPFAAYAFDQTPAPTQPGVNPLVAANWFGPSPTGVDDSTYTVRIDHRLRDQDQIYGRYTIGSHGNTSQRGNTPFITLDKMWNYVSSGEDMQSAMVAWNHVFSPTFFVETIATGSRMYWQYDQDAPGAQENVAAKFGTPNPFDRYGSPKLTDLGFSLGYDGPVPRTQDTKPISGEQNYTLVRGKHQFEFGWLARRQMLDVMPDRPMQAIISFASGATSLYDPATRNNMGSVPRTGYDTANFFLGVAGSYQQTRPAGWFNLRSNELSGYFQDTWRVTQNLTLNLGLRYEYLSPMLDTNGVNSVFDMATHSIVRKSSIDDLIRNGYTTPALVKAYTDIGVRFATPGEVGLPDSLVNVGQRNFSPRAGFAYKRVVNSHTLVLRGGYGAYHFALPARTFNAQRGAAPLQGTFSYNISSAAQSPDGRKNWGLRSAPAVVAGVNSADVIDPNSPNAIARGITVDTFDSSLPTSLTHEWNFTLETELMRNTLFRVAYMGTAGRYLDQTQQINGQPNNYVWFATTGEPLPTGPYSGVIRRSFDQTTYGNIDMYRKTGYSNYNGIQVELQRRFSNGLAFQWFYVMSNALSTGSGGDLADVTVPDPAGFMPGAVPEDYDARNRFFNYGRDTDVPKHRINWNFLFDLPVGRGKKWLSNSGGVLDRIVGGWQLAGYSTMRSRYWALPATDWGYLGDVQVYGTKYKVEDCRSGVCIPGYLYYNGYIPANRINSYDAQGRPNGVMGVPKDYRPSHTPIWTTPANGGNPADPNYSLYESDMVFLPMKNGTQQRIAMDTGIHPWRNQYIPGPWNFTVNASLFKVIPIKERMKLRLNMDFFNVLNQPGLVLPNAGSGILSLQNSANEPRQLQWTLRLTW